MKNAITEILSYVVHIMTRRMEEAEKCVRNIEDKIMEKNEAEKKRERKVFYYKFRLRELSNSIRHNSCIITIPEKKRGKRRQKVYLSK